MTQALPSRILLLFILFLSCAQYTLSAPSPSNTKDLEDTVANKVARAVDQCPTPRTQFLPYPPPPNYVPGPGCPPASEGTQPTEFNPPPGVYGGYNPSSGSGSGSATGTGAASSGGFVTRMLGGNSKCWFYWMLGWVIIHGRLA